jgi:D-amino-acid dehydrogenase
MSKSVIVLGAGMVGVSCALELQQRGWSVRLVDRRGPGEETSWGNAGVLATSSLIPFNNPGLWRSLPRLLTHRSPALRYDPWYALARLPWVLGFLARARPSTCEATAVALDALIRLSRETHGQWLREAGETRRLRENGWLYLYRSLAAFEAAAPARALYARHGVQAEVLDAAGLRSLEPDLAPLFPRALWLSSSASVDSPGAVVQAYARLFKAGGGQLLLDEVRGLRPASDDAAKWQVHTASGQDMRADQVVVALGPWSRDALLRWCGLRIPMAYERGYHMHYGGAGGARLNRPVYDTAGGYVLSPMAQGLRLSTGVEWADLNAPSRTAQLDLAQAAAREAFALGERLDAQAWRGARPTLPDSRPHIGAAPGRRGLWLALGHQHIGFSTGPGTARVLADLMAQRVPPIDAAPFSPLRFG